MFAIHSLITAMDIISLISAVMYWWKLQLLDPQPSRTTTSLTNISLSNSRKEPLRKCRIIPDFSLFSVNANMDICPPCFFYVSIYAQDKLHGLSDRLDKHLIRASRVRQETEQQAANLKVGSSS